MTHSQYRQLHKRQRQRRKVIFSVLILGVLGLAGYFLVSAFFRPAPPALAGNVIDIKADMAGFDQKEVHVKVGESVTIRLTSLDNSYHTDGGGKHQLAVDELGLNVIVQPESSDYVTFTPDKPGTFVFYCDICCGGRANPTMNGTLIVEG
jgi:plastocyanin